MVREALRDVYERDPLDFLAEGGQRPELSHWCEAEGLETEVVTALLRRELSPLYPAFGTLPSRSPTHDLRALGAALVDCDSAELELLVPHLVTQLLAGRPVYDHQEGPWPELALARSGERDEGMAALLSGYDRAMRGRPRRAQNPEAALWQRLRRHLRAFHARRFLGLAVEPLLSLSLQVEASHLDPALLQELGQLIVQRGDVVRSSTELGELVALARVALGREPPAPPPGDGGASFDDALESVERQAEELDERLRPFGKRAVIHIQDRDARDLDGPIVVVVVAKPCGQEPAPANEPPLTLPDTCETCHASPGLRERLHGLRGRLPRSLTELRPPDELCPVPP